jgi:hypothetical protein
MINNQSSLNDQFNPALAVDDATGRVAIIYYDTVADSGRLKTLVYYQASFDDGISFGAPFQVATAQTDETVSGANSGNQYGDYNSLTGYASAFFPSWTDRRSGGREEIWTAGVTEKGCMTLYGRSFESDSGLAGWSTGFFGGSGGTTSWRGVQACTAHGGTNIFRYGGVACTDNYTSNNFTFAQPNGAAGIAVPAGTFGTRLSFWHRRFFESGFDGGTLTISVNGTNFFFVPASAILSGTRYNGTTSTSCPPPGGGGVAVFTGVSSSFTNTLVDLDAACNVATGTSTGCAGRSVRIGFTSITDCAVTSDGWFLDDVTVSACMP